MPASHGQLSWGMKNHHAIFRVFLKKDFQIFVILKTMSGQTASIFVYNLSIESQAVVKQNMYFQVHLINTGGIQ